MENTYRWSPDVEARVVALLRIGCKASVICERIGCSSRTARRFVDRWKAGLDLFHANGSRPSNTNVPAVRVKRPVDLSGARRPGYRWVADVNTLSDDERAAYRSGIYDRADAGWPIERIADRFKMRMSIVRRILAERAGTPMEGEDDRPFRLASVSEPWPKITASHDDWPADQRFEDSPKAVRADRAGEVINGMSHVYRYTRTALDRQSYCSNASAWAAL